MEHDIDFKEEIEPFLGQFNNYTIRTTHKGEELLSSSPFREDTSPSFSLNLDTGLWIDFGSNSEIWSKGNFFKLVSFLTGEHYEDVVRAYTEKYKGILNDLDQYELKISLESKKTYRTFNLSDYPYNHHSDYLNKRGITEKAKRFFNVGYDKQNKAISIPYFDRHGNLVNIKFRKVNHKQFYYLPNGQAIGNHVYALDKIFKHQFTTVFVTESEIDCMYLWSYGIPAIALGTANMSVRQRELIELSPIETLVMAFDNDKAGNKVTKDVYKRLVAKVRLKKLQLPDSAKDVNDIPVDVLKEKKLKVQDLTPKFKIL